MPIRQKIAAEFNIAKKRPTHVSDNHVVDDGYMVADIEMMLTAENIRAYLDCPESDVSVLWDMLVSEMDGTKMAPYSGPTSGTGAGLSGGISPSSISVTMPSVPETEAIPSETLTTETKAKKKTNAKSKKAE